LECADLVYVYADPNLTWAPQSIADALGPGCSVCSSVEEILARVAESVAAEDHVVIMSNGSFSNIHSQLLAALD
jgi:UDP-N-acetylmuramate: L-alanyl-gamma-D-glutamyl-meso-diaminopimelate ligase